MISLRSAAAALVLGAVAVTSLAGCSKDEGKKPTQNAAADADGDGDVSPDEVLEFAKTKLDDTSGVKLRIATSDEPNISTYLKDAEGVITRAPAFEGTASAVASGLPVNDAAVISVDGKFHVQVLGTWQTFKPEDLCAPDPAELLDPDHGVSTVLSDAESIEEGESEIDGDNRDVVITTYTATVPGETVQRILPCAPGDEFKATFSIDSEGVMRSARLTGEFFSGADMSYTITIVEYGVEKEITAP